MRILFVPIASPVKRAIRTRMYISNGRTRTGSISTTNLASPRELEPPAWVKVRDWGYSCLNIFFNTYSFQSVLRLERTVLETQFEASQNLLIHSPLQAYLLKTYLGSTFRGPNCPPVSLCGESNRVQSLALRHLSVLPPSVQVP